MFAAERTCELCATPRQEPNPSGQPLTVAEVAAARPCVERRRHNVCCALVAFSNLRVMPHYVE
ncbi:hypothetical protein KS43_22665 [Pectobacterium odoriferum]|nr:hypothetical protein KS43_22665 [Pectobacterium odoriferum]